MIHNRKLIKYYKDYTIMQEMNYKNEGTFFSISSGTIDEKFLNSINVKYSYFETIEEAEKFIDEILKEEQQ